MSGSNSRSEGYAEPVEGRPNLIRLRGTERLFAVGCASPSYYELYTSPEDVAVTRADCAGRGTSISICPWLNVEAFKAKAGEEIVRRVTHNPYISECSTGCERFQPATFDKTKGYRGTDAVYVDT